MTKWKPIFSFYTYYKLTLWSIVLMVAIFISANLFSDDSIVVSVKPIFSSKYYDSSIIQFKQSSLLLRGALVIDKPTFYEKIILPHEYADFSFLKNIFLLLGCVVLLKILPNTKEENLFKVDISKSIIAIGLLIIIYSFLELTQNFIALTIIKEKTDGQFVIVKHNFFNILFLIGCAIIWFGKTYKKAFKLQQQQNLTI